MIVKVNRIKDDKLEEIIVALDKYINRIKKEMIDIDSININTEDKEKIIESVKANNEIVNSYIENNLSNFKETLKEYMNYKKEN